jgi:hypothetical protein
MLSATLCGHEVIRLQRWARPMEKRLLSFTWMRELLYREECPLNGVVGLV